MTVPPQTGDTPERLTLQATLVLIAVALGLAFGAAVMVGGGASAAKPIAERGPALVRNPPGPAMDPELTAARALPALRAPRTGGVQPRRPTGVTRRSATPALTLVSAPASSAEPARPTPAAVPRPVTPPPPRAAPTPTPEPEPTPIATPKSSGDFDTTGEPASEGADQIPPTNRTSAGVAK